MSETKASLAQTVETELRKVGVWPAMLTGFAIAVLPMMFEQQSQKAKAELRIKVIEYRPRNAPF